MDRTAIDVRFETDTPPLTATGVAQHEARASHPAPFAATSANTHRQPLGTVSYDLNSKLPRTHWDRPPCAVTDPMPALKIDDRADPEQHDETLGPTKTRGGDTTSIAGDSELGIYESIFFGPFCLIESARLLVKDGAPVAIGGRALDLLIVLTARAGEILTVQELVAQVWPGVVVEESNLRVCISALRKALGDGREGARYIINVAGRGYTFVAPVRRSIADDAIPAAMPASPSRCSNLPLSAKLTIGRNETVDALSLQLLTRRFVTVVGPGGVGKTTVAIAVANALRDKFDNDAVYFVDLGRQTDPAAVPGAVAMALGCYIEGLDPESSLLAFLADKRALTVLDGCEHLIEAVAPLAERIFHKAPWTHLLTTSREALRVEGENVHLLLPLGCPPDDFPSAAVAMSWPAVQLFMERAKSSGHRSDLSEADAPLVSNICRRLDGIPLALELAASRVGIFGIQGVADLLDNGTELLLQGRRRGAPRHQSLQALLDSSFHLLSAYEQRVLCRLSGFVGLLDLEAARALAGDTGSEPQAVSKAIGSLADKSLLSIWSAKGSTYIRLLHTTRAYAAAKLTESGEAEAVAGRYAGYFAALPEGKGTTGGALSWPQPRYSSAAHRSRSSIARVELSPLQ